MINMILFGTKPEKALKLNVSYQHHQASSQKLIIYNQGNKKIALLKVSVYNQKQEVFHYQLENINIKTALTIDYKNKTDLNNNYFEGQIKKIILSVKDKQFVFMAVGEKFIKD